MNLNWRVRIALYQSLVDALKTPVVKFYDEKTTLEALHLFVIAQLLHRKNFNVEWAKDHRLAVTLAEAISIMWHLRKYDDNTLLLNLKCELHKQLHS
jgi:hypothetical protein